MLLPYLSEVQNTSKKYSVLFRGINYGEGTQEGEFSETYNISTDNYPCITQRRERIKEEQYTNPTTLHAKGKLLVIDGTKVLYDGVEIGTVAEGKKQTATIGNYIVIFPDKVYYQVPSQDESEGKFGSLEETYKSETKEIYKQSGFRCTTSTITTEEDDDYPFKAGDVITFSNFTGSFIENNVTAVVKEVSGKTLIFEDGTFPHPGSSSSQTITITRSGVVFTDSEIIPNGANFQFNKGDAVEISGCSNNGNNKIAIIRAVSENKLTFDENTFTAGEEDGSITLKREVPDLDYICESNYRLWGTYENTIYSSKYSDPFNFKVFEGLSSDSYYIQVGSEGNFTGCIPYSSHICFFKENTLHKLYGTKPSNYQITTVNVYGVQSGSERSMHIVNEQLLYKGVGGVYSYAGGIPELISANFGNQRYSEAVACCDGEKYYISMKKDNEWNLFSYDVLRNIWIREDDTHVIDMVFHNGKIYYIDSEGCLYCIDNIAPKNNIAWSATFCPIHETINERKGYSKFHFRLDLSEGAWFAIDIKTDTEPQWREIYSVHGVTAKTISVPIIPTRCDSIDIRLRGKGECTVKTFIREFTVGSDI